MRREFLDTHSVRFCKENVALSASFLRYHALIANLTGPPMQPEQFKRWRKRLGLKQKDVAELLGLKKRIIQYYEKGDRDGRKVEIPKTVQLACYAISRGIREFNGEDLDRA